MNHDYKIVSNLHSRYPHAFSRQQKLAVVDSTQGAANRVAVIFRSTLGIVSSCLLILQFFFPRDDCTWFAWWLSWVPSLSTTPLRISWAMSSQWFPHNGSLLFEVRANSDEEPTRRSTVYLPTPVVCFDYNIVPLNPAPCNRMFAFDQISNTSMIRFESPFLPRLNSWPYPDHVTSYSRLVN
jgi:hypothetical protein